MINKFTVIFFLLSFITGVIIGFIVPSSKKDKTKKDKILLFCGIMLIMLWSLLAGWSITL